MKLSVAKNGAPRYFTAKLGWKEQFDPKEIEMLSAGVVPALIPPTAVQGRKNNVIEYDVTPYTSLEFYLTCILSKEQFVELLGQFVELFRRMQSVYLNYKNLVLGFDQVYIQLSDRSLHLVYLPLRDSKRDASIPELLRKLAQTVNRSTYEQVTFLGQITAFLDRPAPFALNEFAQLLREGPTAPAKPAPVPPAPPAPPAYSEPAARTYTPPAAPITAEVDGTVVLQPQGGTVILGQTPPPPLPHGFLIRTKTGCRSEIRAPQFRIGKEAGQVEFYINDNPAVSRSHAEILIREGQFYLKDVGSTNKTYLNGCALEPQTENLLEDGAHVRFANEEFTFTVEG